MLRLEQLESRDNPSSPVFTSVVGKIRIPHWPGTLGELRQSAELPSVQYLAGETPAVRTVLNAVPALTLDLSRVSVAVVPVAQWTRPMAVSAYYQGTGNTPASGVITIRAGEEWAAAHELGHAIDHKQGSLQTRTSADAEWYAWAFHRWVFDAEENVGFDVMEA